MFKVQFIIIFLCLVILGVVLNVIRKGKIMEKYALLWIYNLFCIISVAIFPIILFKLSSLLNVHYITTILVFFVLFFVTVLFYYSITLSSLTEQNKKISQELGIVKLELKELKKRGVHE